MSDDPRAPDEYRWARQVSAVLLIAVVVSPQIEGSDDLQRSLTTTTVVFAAIGFLLYLWCFASSRGTVQRDVASVGLRETAGMIRDNRPLVLLCVSSLLFLGGMFCLSTVGVFYPSGSFRPGGFAFADIATVLTTNGQMAYCSDCTIANPCAGGGSGAIAKRLNGVNVCN